MSFGRPAGANVGGIHGLFRRACHEPASCLAGTPAAGNVAGMAKQKASKRPTQLIVRLQLDLPAKGELERLAGRRGMTQSAVVSRMIEWFAGQDEVIQASVLNLLSEEHLGDVSTGMLRRLAGSARTAE